MDPSPLTPRQLSELEAVAHRRVPGLAVVVVRDGRIASASGIGVRDLDGGRPTTPDTAHLWFSMTKIVTATAVMQLVERGALGLDDPVRDSVPGFPPVPRGWPEVRIRHLLSHSSGLANPVPVGWVHRADESGPDRRDFALGLLGRHRRLRFRAGTRAAYSNLGYLALGEAIAAASGQGFEDHVRSQILAPLGMTSTGFSFEEAGGEAATGYQRRLDPMTPLVRMLLPKGIVGRRAGRFVAFNRFYVDGPAYGGLVGTARDAARFAAAHLDSGESDGVRLLSPGSAAEMQRIQAQGRRLEVGFGWLRRGSRARRRDLAYLEHPGGGAGFWTLMRIYPAKRTAVVTMGNATSYDHDRIAEVVTAG